MKLSFEVSYFDPSGKIRFSAVREGWAEENGTWCNPELGLAFAFRLDPERRSYVRRTEKLKRDTAVIKRMTDDIAALASTQKAFLDDFILHNRGAVAESVYSTGVHVFVNCGDDAVVLPCGIRVPARDIAVKL